MSFLSVIWTTTCVRNSHSSTQMELFAQILHPRREEASAADSDIPNKDSCSQRIRKEQVRNQQERG